MGIEWINRTDRTYSRSIAKCRSSLLIPRLLDAKIAEVKRTFRVQLKPDKSLQPGTRVLVHTANGTIALLDDNERIIAASNQMPEWIQQVAAEATERLVLGIVDGVNLIAGTADVSLTSGVAK